MVEKDISVVAVDDSSVRDLGNAWGSYWLNSHEILTYRFGIERYQLLLVDLDTGNSTEIWEGQFGGYEVDPTGTWVVLDAISSTIPPKEEKPGFIYGSIQLINLKTLENIQNPEPILDPPDLFVRANDGTIVNLVGGGTIVASPDAKYWAVAFRTNMKIYSQNLALIKDFSIPFQSTDPNDMWPYDIQWSPDSSGLFLMYGKFNRVLYFVNISSGDVNLIEKNLTGGAKWLKGQ